MGSHDFIRFPPYQLNLSPSLLMLLGGIQARIEHIRQIPISPVERDRLEELYFVRAVHGTTAIEGNTLSEDDVRRLFDDTIEKPSTQEYNEREVLNIREALADIAEKETTGEGIGFSLDLLNRFHRLVMSNTGSLNCAETEIGAIRKRGVEVGRYRGAPARECQYLIEKYCDWLNQTEYEPEGLEDYKMAWQIIKAVVAHIYFAWIHPFCDGNGRMARLLEYKIVIAADVPNIAAYLLSNMYNKRRIQYVTELQESHGDYNDGAYPAEANIQRFVEFALEGYKHELDEQITEIHATQLDAMWRQTIHNSFASKKGTPNNRRKMLVSELAKHRRDVPVRISDVRGVSPLLATTYRDTAERTIRRDLDELVQMQLLKRDSQGYMPNMEILFNSIAKIN